jgi:twitching motility protein PilT
MALLDSPIRALFSHDADAIGIATGHPVLVIARGERKPLTPDPMAPAQIEQMLREVLPADRLGVFQQQGSVEHIHDARDGAVKITARRAGAGVQIMLVKADRAAPPPRGPLSQEGAAANSSPPAAARTSSQEGPPTGPQPRPGSGEGSAIEVMRLSKTPSVPQGEALPPLPPLPPLAGSAAPAPAAVRPRSAPGGDKPIDDLFRELVAKKGSDLYVCTGKKPLIRKDGDLVPVGPRELSEEEAKQLLYAITPDDQLEQFERESDADFAYEIEGLARFRANLFRDRNGVGGIFRQIPAELLTAEKLGLAPAILELCMLNKGLVLVTGPTGSGKSTTLAAMLDYVNRNRSAHIITIEDPIEFVHKDKKCVINQREVGSHTQGFKRALRAALREDPDIVLVGEMRDLETVAIAIETAETGHLVFGTLHTNTAASTVDRIIDQFPADQQQQIRTMLAEALKGVISQTLCKKKGGGRVAALEVLLGMHAVSNLIREAKTHQIPSIMQTSRQAGMITLNEALMELVEKKLVTAEEAMAKAIDKAELRGRYSRAGIVVA